jgi:hypothetical protein
MRSLISRAMLATVAAMILGCSSSSTPTKSAAHTDKAADIKACVMQSGGHDVLWLEVPADTECVPKDGSLLLSSQHRTVEFWLVNGAKTVDEAIGRVPEQIKDEFKNLKVTESLDLTVAGTPAKRQQGSGEEADDGDPGKADVIVFKIGEHIFVVCTHGEALNAPAQEWMLTLAQAAKES